MHYVFNTEVRGGRGMTSAVFICPPWLLAAVTCTARISHAVGRQLCDCQLFKKSLLSVMWEVSHILTKLTPASAAQGPTRLIATAPRPMRNSRREISRRRRCLQTRESSLLKLFSAQTWKLQSGENFWDVCYGRFQFHPQQVGNLNNWHLNPVWPPSLQATKLMGWFSHDFPVSLPQRTKQHPHLCDFLICYYI